MILHGDFETFSRAPLKKCGAYRYAADASTEVLCFCWKIDDGEVETWVPSISGRESLVHKFPADWHYGLKVPPTLTNAIRAGATFTAHNAQFERAIWQNVVHKRHGGPATRREQFVCTATRAAASGLPRALETLADALGNRQQKDKEGSRLLKMFAMPRKPTKADARDRIMPTDAPDDFIKLVQYCQQDVRTESEVDEIVPHLNDYEQRLYAFDMQINERGFRIDIPMVRRTQRILAHLEKKVVDEVMELTKSTEFPIGIRPTQRDKMLKFFHDNGVMLENMQADHVRKYMVTNVRTLSATGRRLLQLRIEAGKASTKKLSSMIAYAGLDGIARGTLMSYGAHTGRYSGKGIQPHNFIRGLLKWAEQLRIFALLMKGDHEAFEMLYEWPISAIAQTMRGFIIPSDGMTFYVVDYASIEARVLSWLADDQEMLVAFANGIDVYKLMATVIYNCTLEEVTSEQRRVAKNVVLGCFAGETEILTLNGWKRIDQITLNDAIYDGTGYVFHDGVVYQGDKETIWLDGVRVTSEHRVWNVSQWQTASSIAGDSKYLQSALDSVVLPFEHTGLVPEEGWMQSSAAATAGESLHHLSIMSQPGGARQAAMSVLNKRLLNGWRQVQTIRGANTVTQNLGNNMVRMSSKKKLMSVLRRGLSHVQDVVGNTLRAATSWLGVNLRAVMPAGSGRSTVTTQMGAGCAVSGTPCTREQDYNRMVKEHFKSVSSGTRSFDSYRLAEKLQAIDPALTGYRSTESTMNGDTIHGTFDSALNGKISSTSEPTFDILNCGPNSRFVIRTHSGAMIVHNCGYGLGAVKFVSYSEKAGVEITEELAKFAVNIYRKERYKIVNLWGDVERAAIAAVREKRTTNDPVKLRMLQFFIEARWLCIRLPSGRLLRYYQPRVSPVEKWGKPSLQLSYKVDFRGRMFSEATYGGKLVENITQAIARDLLVNGMFMAEKAGYTVRGTVHDEIITERPIGKGNIHELEKLACKLPSWARGMPISAEGFESPRYRKG